MEHKKTSMVYFVGAGPGDPELITVKGQKLLANADVIIYAGSLVSEEVLAYASQDAQQHNSAKLNLEKQVALMTEAIAQGKSVVRLHTGDPSIYGAIAEQIKALDQAGIPYRVVPGVSSAFAAAAALAIELTLPERTQTVILTRLSGRTPVPESEALAKLAAHKSSLMIFLSAGMIERVVQELLDAGYPEDTPVAVVYRVTWPEEIIVKGTLATIAQQVLQAEITHHALIVVSPSLDQGEMSGAAGSHLYGAAHDRPERENTIAIISLTRKGTQTGKRLLKELPHSFLYAPDRFLDDDDERIIPTITSIRQTLQTAFQRYQALVCITASGIVVRELAPMLKSKHVDPAVVNLGEAGNYAVSLLSGHKGGANALAKEVAQILGGQAVISTASDTQGLPALDLLEKEYDWKLESAQHLTVVSAAMVNGESIGIYQDCGARDWLPDPTPNNFHSFSCLHSMQASEMEATICITYQDVSNKLKTEKRKSLLYHPRCLYVGVGCNRGTPKQEIWEAIQETFETHQLSLLSIAALATIDQKADEPGLKGLIKERGWPLIFYNAEQLSAVPDLPNPSTYAQKAVGAPGVSEPAALLSAQADTLLVEKQKFPNVTMAVALKDAT